MSAPVLWWVSWKDRTQNHPRRGIPVPNVIAWWITGWAADDSYRTIVALVDSRTRRGVDMILGTDWPSYDGPRQWRFRNKLEAEYLPDDVVPKVRVLTLTDCWPLEKWVIERLRGIGVCVRVKS